MHASSRLNYGWVVVAAGALIGCIALGALFSLAVFLQPMADATGWSRAGISASMTLDFISMGVAGFAWGMLSDRYGPRIVLLCGSVLLALGLFLASRAQSLLEFQLLYGGLVGIAAGSFFAPLIATVSGWFDEHRGIAVSLVSAGMGVAPLTMSPFAAWLITQMDWRSAQLTIAALVAVVMLPASLLVRAPPKAAPIEGLAPADEVGSSGASSVAQALRSPHFIVLGLVFFACCAAHSGPIFHTVSYAIGCGLPTMAAVSIYSVEGLAGLGGRVLLGLLADRIGVKPVLVAGLLVQAVAAGLYLFVRELGEFYLLAAVFGAAYGGTMPLYALLARDYFGQRIMGTVFGAATMISSLGMALGPAIGGWIYDSFRGYDWLYIGSFGIGIGAAVIALMFPPLLSDRMKRHAAA